MAAFLKTGPFNTADAWTADGRPLFLAHMRHLPIETVRVASFAVALGGRIEDKRPPLERTVAGCEGDKCAIRADDKPLLYTAFSRAQISLTIIGEIEAIPRIGAWEGDTRDTSLQLMFGD